MSDNPPFGDSLSHKFAESSSEEDSEEIESKTRIPDHETRLVLPDPLPVGTNPFLVLNWILFTAHVAARFLTQARLWRIEELGRKMRTEYRGHVPMLHRDDDVDRDSVYCALNKRLGFSWQASLSAARNLCAEFRIPFDTFDQLLKAASDELNEVDSIIQGVAGDRTVYYGSETTTRLHELAESTTPRLHPLISPALPPAPAVDSPPTEIVKSEGGTPQTGRKRGIPLAEAEILVGDWLKKKARNENASCITRDEVAGETGVSTGQVSKTVAWRAFDTERKKKAKPGPREVPLSEEMQARIPADCTDPALLASLIEEQEKERKQDEKPRRHKLRHDGA